jgi:hypothetical protein
MAKGRNKQRNFDNITIDQLIKQEPKTDSLPEQNTSELQTIDPYKVNNTPAVKQPLILEAIAPHRVNNIAPTISALTGENPDEKQVIKEVADKEIQYLDNLNALKQVLDNNELSKFNKVMLPGGERTIGESALGKLIPSNPDIKISPTQLEEINKIYQMNKEAEKPKNYKGLKEFQKDLDKIEYLDNKYSSEEPKNISLSGFDLTNNMQEGVKEIAKSLGTPNYVPPKPIEYDPEDEKELKNLINKRNTLVGIHNNLTFGEKEDYKLFNAQKKINELKNKPNFDKDLSNVGGHIYSGVLNALNMTVGADYQGEIKSDIRKDETNKNIENEYKEVTEPKTLFGQVVQGLATTAALAPMFAFGFNAGGVKVGAGYLKNLVAAAKGSALAFAPGGASKGIQKTVAEVKNRESKGEQLDTFDRIWIGTKNIGGEVIKNTMEGVSEMMIPGFNPGKTFLKSILVNAPLNIITETATEQVSDITGDLVDGTNTSLLVSLLRTGKFSEESINQVLVEAIIAGIYGSAVGGGQFWAEHLQKNLDKKDYATINKYVQENKPALEKNLSNVIDKTVNNTKKEVSEKIKDTESKSIEGENTEFNINPEQVDNETGFTNFPELENNDNIITSDPRGLFVVANLERGLEDDFKRKRRIIDEKIVTSQLDNVVGKRERKRLENLYIKVLEHNRIAKKLINGKTAEQPEPISEELPNMQENTEPIINEERSNIPVAENIVTEEEAKTEAINSPVNEKEIVDDVEKKINKLFKSNELISEDVITSTLDNVRSESEITRLLELYDKVVDHNGRIDNFPKTKNNNITDTELVNEIESKVDQLLSKNEIIPETIITDNYGRVKKAKEVVRLGKILYRVWQHNSKIDQLTEANKINSGKGIKKLESVEVEEHEDVKRQEEPKRAKLPYEMTSTEYESTLPTNTQEATFAKARHEQEVLSAYMKGLAIPPKVLAEYPNLKENAEKLRKENAEYEKKKTTKESKNAIEKSEKLISGEELDQEEVVPERTEMPVSEAIESVQKGKPNKKEAMQILKDRSRLIKQKEQQSVEKIKEGVSKDGGFGYTNKNHGANGIQYTLSKDSRDNKKWKVAYFDEKGAIGDRTFNDFDEAVTEFVKESGMSNLTLEEKTIINELNIEKQFEDNTQQPIAKGSVKSQLPQTETQPEQKPIREAQAPVLSSGEKTFYRGGGIGSMPKGKTADDVINYEANELGNEISIETDIDLKSIPSEKLQWLTETEESAREYGESEKVIPKNYRVIARDMQGGVLIENLVDNLKQSLIDRTELQLLQDRRKHLELVIDNPKSSTKIISEAKKELIAVNKKLYRINSEESQLDAFDNKENQMQLFSNEKSTRPAYNNMSEKEKKEFLRIITNAFLEENPEIFESDLTVDNAAAVTIIKDYLKTSIGFDPKTADIVTAIHEANHLAVLNLLPENKAKDLLKENGWDGKGDYRQPSSNPSLVNAYETLAKANENWYKSTKEFEGKKLTGKFITFLKDLWNKLASFLHRQGFYSQSGFFENLYTGRLKEMAVAEQTNRVNEIIGEQVLAQKKNITETENFKKWFGDSKVVDENGEPLVVYHGTGSAKEFIEFKPDMTGKGNDQLGSGFYFTTDPDEASGYTTHRTARDVKKLGGEDSPAVIPVFVSLQKPIMVKGSNLSDSNINLTENQAYQILKRSPEIYDIEETQLWNFIDIGGGVKDWMIRKVAKEYTGSSLMSLENDFFRNESTLFRETVHDVTKYDGVVMDLGNGEKHYVAWFPTQIKSAIGNNGNFDPNNPNILKQGLNTEEQQSSEQQENEESINDYGKYIFENGKNKYSDWVKQMRNIYGENKLYATQFAKLLRDSIKGKTVSAKNESIPKEDQGTVNSIGEDTENRDKFVRMRERTFILEKIKQYKKGYREGRSDTKKELEFLKNQIAAYARQYLPKTLEKYKITPLLTAIAKATKIGHVEYSLKKIDEYVDKSIKNSLITKILKKLETYKPKKENSVLKGKILTADEYKILDDIRNIIKMPRSQVADMRVRILSQVENTGKELSDEMDENFYRLNLFSDLSNKTAEELQETLNEINEIIGSGRTKRQREREAYRQKTDGLIRTILREITRGGRGVLTEQEIKKAGEGNRRFYNFMTYIHNLESIFDAITFDKSKGMYQGTLNKQFIPQIKEGHRLQYAWENEVITQVRDKLMEIYGINEADNSSYRARKKLNKAITANREEIENTGVTYINPRTGKREELALSQNTAAKKWMESQMDNLAETFKAMGWDEQTFDELDKFIKPQVKRWARYQIEVLYPELAKKVNAKYKSYFGINMPISENYNPISRKYNGVDSNENSPLTGSSSHLATVINNHLKATTKNTRPLEFTDMDSVLGEYVVQMAHFVAFADVVKEMRGVIQNEAIQNAIEQEVGGMYKSTINQHIEDIARGGTNSKFMIRWLEKRLNNFVPAVLAINPSIFLKQLSSLFAYSAEIPRDEFLKGVADYIANPAKVVKFLSETDAWKLRYGKGFERDLIAWNKKNTPNTFAGQKTLKDALMIMISLGDKGSVTAGGWSVYKYYYEKSIKEGKSIKEAEKIAETEFQTITGRTQQSGETEDLSTLQKLGTFGKIITLFMTQPVSYFRQEWGAARNIARGRGKLSDNLYKVAMYHVVLPSFFQYVASGFPGLFSDWDDEDERRMARAATVGSFNGLFIVGNILESIMGTIYGSRFFDSGQVPLQQIPESVSKTIYKLTKIVDERRYLDMDIRDFLEVVDAVFMTVDKLVGVPYYTGKRIVQGVRDLVEGEGAPMKALGYSDFSLGEDSKRRITPETIGWNIRKRVADEIIPLLKAKKFAEARSKLIELQDKIMPVLIEDIDYKSEKNLNKLKRQVKPLIEQGETIEANKELRILQQKINRDKASAARQSKNLYYFGSLVNQRLTDEEDGQYKELFKNWRLNQYRGVSPSLLKKYPD